MTLKALVLVAALSAPAAAAEAPPEPEKGGYTLGARAVYYIPADGEHGSWNPGAQARYFFMPRLAGELSADYQRHLFPETTVHTAAGQLSLLGFIGEGRLRGYGLVGAGYYPSRVHGPNYRRNIGRFAAHLGAGAEVWIDDRWSVDLGYRHLFLPELETRDPVTGALRKYKRAGEQLAFSVNRRFGAGERP